MGEIIKVENLTKDYGFGRGVFDVSFSVSKGEVFGFLGPNGAGKTTTIRHIMGFSKPQTGNVSVFGIDCFKCAKKIQYSLGYLPGEIALPENMTGWEFIKHMAGLRKMTDLSHTEKLLAMFKLDLGNRKLKSLALGERRKLAIVTAFMHDPEVLVLDEPTSGLDPIGQETFINFVKEEKKSGKTILLSSHIFQEVEACCDRISIIKAGKIVNSCSIDDIQNRDKKTFILGFEDAKGFAEFQKEPFNIVLRKEEKLQLRIFIDDKETNLLLSVLKKYKLKYLAEDKYTLQDHFMHFYEKEETLV